MPRVNRQRSEKGGSAMDFQSYGPQNFSFFFDHPEMLEMPGGYILMGQFAKREQLPDPGLVPGRG
jgi:hypothetical protein